MINFLNDYNNGAHPDIMDALIKHNADNYPGYGTDAECRKAAVKIKNIIGNNDADIHFLTGGTSCNKIVIAHALKPYESVIAAYTGHINIHETGAVESSGHKINLAAGNDGKITASGIRAVAEAHSDEHMVKPKMVYISNATETGTVYKKHELIPISEYCRKNDIYLYLDGARLGVALTAEENDLTLADIAALTDVFYIGGTKNGALLGEAIVITNNNIKPMFRHSIKQQGGLLAKGFVLGLQFDALFSDGLFFRIGEKANAYAGLLSAGLHELNIASSFPVHTNQIFITLPDKVVSALRRGYLFETWEKHENKTTIRLVTSWATAVDDIKTFLTDLENIIKR